MRAVKTLIVALVIVAAIRADAAPAGDPMPWQPNLEVAQQLAARTNRLVLIHFWAPWCQPCLRLEREVFSKPETARALEANFVLVKLNTDEAPGTARLYGVSSLPSDVIISPSGRLVSQMQSPPTASQYIAQLNQAAAGHRELTRRPTQQVSATPVAAPQAGVAPQMTITTGQPGAVMVSPQYTIAQTQTAQVPVNQVPIAQSPTAQAPVGQAPVAQMPIAQAPINQGQVMQPAAPVANTQVPVGPPVGVAIEQTPAGNGPVSDTALAPAAQTAPIATIPATADPAANAQSATAPAASTAPAAAMAPPTAGPVDRYAEYFNPPASAPPVQSPPQAVAPEHQPPATGAVQASPYAAAGPAQNAYNSYASYQQQPSIPQLPPGCPPLGLDGNCPVTLVERMQWRVGDRAWGAVHRGRTYLFAGQEERDRFLTNPDLYSPVMSGVDPVLAIDNQIVVPGKREFGVFGADRRIYLFADESTLKRFEQNPKRYAAESMQLRR